MLKEEAVTMASLLFHLVFLVAPGLGQGWQAGVSQVPKWGQSRAVLQSTLARGSLLGGREGRSGGPLLRDCVGAALAEGLSLRPPRAGPLEQLQAPSSPYLESESLSPFNPHSFPAGL